jgi:hypothetical protein
MTGTSQATAFVSGIAALMISTKRGLSVADLKSKITASATKYSQLIGKTQFGAAANAYAAVASLSKTQEENSPAAPSVKPASRSFAAASKNPASIGNKKLLKKNKKFNAKKGFRN